MKKIIILILVLGIALIAIGIYMPKDFSSEKEVFFNIERGEGSKEIAFNLEKEGLIIWAPIFRVYVHFKGISGNLQAGQYSITPSMNIPEIAEKFKKGEILKDEITIIEGWNLRDIGFSFENRGMFQAEELWELAGFPAIDYLETGDLPLPKDFSSDYGFLKDKPKSVGLEGYLFPDTYQINRGAAIEEIVIKMLNNFDKKLSLELREEISKQGKTIFEIITMASIIEKEVRGYEDKKIVSGILWKRLENKFPLQVCPSITYITGNKSVEITNDEKAIDSPFNTYKYLGLPLGPISNPGIESIEAAIYPEASDYWYFLNRQDTGETIFSRTLEEHNIAKAKYL